MELNSLLPENPSSKVSQVSGDEDFNAHYEFMKNSPNMEIVVKRKPLQN